MIFTCENCLYTFKADAKPERCPDCGRFGPRDATEQEIAWFMSVRPEEECASHDPEKQDQETGNI